MKVDNYPAARPQSGLDHADIVFEEPVEGGITRYVVVFQCDTAALVGPIRSARQPDVAILSQLHHPIFVHVGGIAPILQMIRDAPVINEDLISTGGSIIQHPAGRVAPYDTYISTRGGWSLAAKSTTPPAPLFSYGPAPSTAKPVVTAHIPFSPTSDEHWTWQAASGSWLLSYGSTTAHTMDGTPITATNVVIESVQTQRGPWVEDAQGDLEVDVTALGSGPVTVLRDGTAISGTWHRSSATSPATFQTDAGQTIPLAPGTTWVALVPSSIGVTFGP